MALIPKAIWEVWILCFWWSAWTLADQYLIQFHPWTEIGGLCFCGVVWRLFACRGVPGVVEPKVQRELANITQATCAGPYQRQSDAV